MSATIADALVSIRPGAAWQMSGTTYDSLVWLDAIQVLPTALEVSNAQASLDAASAVEATREAGIIADANRASWLTKLQTTPQDQIESFVRTNVDAAAVNSALATNLSTGLACIQRIDAAIGRLETAIVIIAKLIALDARK